MYIGDAIALGLTTDIEPFYAEANQDFEPIDWSLLDKMYLGIRFERIVFRAEIELTIAIEDLNVSEDDYIDPEYRDYLERKRNICPKPPGTSTLRTMIREDGSKYYVVSTLWELKHKLDDSNAKYGYGSWSYTVYISTSEAENHSNEYYNDYDDVGRETSVTEEVYFVEDIKRYVKVTEGFREY